MESEGLSEEELIDSLFYRCDIHEKGKVQINTIIEFLKNCLGNGNNEPKLLELADILEEESVEGDITFTAYRTAVKQWIAEVRQRCESTSFLESDGLLISSDNGDIINITESSDGLSGCIETSGIGDGPFRNEQDIGDLLGQLEDLKFQNRKLIEENTKLHYQLESQEETASTLASDLQVRKHEEEHLKKRLKSLQELVDFRQAVMEENEELKSKLSRLKERKKELENKASSLERDNMNLENLTRSLENKWQKTQHELDLTRTELQEQQSACTEHKDLLLQAQEMKNSKEVLLTEKATELADLKEKFQELVESNEKLEEERDHIQTALSDAQGKLQRLQNRLDHYSVRENSFSNEDGIYLEISKKSPKHGYSTPLTRHSICMELKDRLDESKHLPSPLCEKHEISKDVSAYTKPTVLPPYMSAWELDVTNGSLPDYSLELMKSRRGANSGLCEVDIEKKILGLKNLEKDALHKEIIKLYRVNVDLAEKCHKAEVREEELQEMVNQANRLVDQDKEKFHQLEDSLQTSRLADLKDLWRIVQVDVEKECLDSQSDSSEFGSSEYLKHQITQEIETLKNKLHKREAALGALSCTRGKVTFADCQGTSSSTPLVDALAIDVPGNKKKRQHRNSCQNQSPCKECHRTNKKHPIHCNRSVPLMRRNNRVHDVQPHLNSSTSSSTSGIVDLEFNNSVPLLNRTIPQIKFTEGDSGSQTSQSNESNTTDIDTSLKPLDEKSNGKEAMDETRTDSLNPLGHVTNEGKILRRPSYTTAIDNETSSVEDVHISRSRSYSFQTAIEQGQISPTGPPQMISSSSISDSTPVDESTEQPWNGTSPTFSSTPLPQTKLPSKYAAFHPHTVKPYKSDKNKDVPLNEGKAPVSVIAKKDIIENGELESNVEELKQFQDKDPSKSISMSLQAELLKTGMDENKSPCTSKHLSVLLEEDAHGVSGSSRQGSPASSASGAHPTQHISSFLGSEPLSAEFWTLSRSSTRQTDSGHSSSLTGSSSFQNKKEMDISDISTNNSHLESQDLRKRSGVSTSLSPKSSSLSLKSSPSTNLTSSSSSPKIVISLPSSPPRNSVSSPSLLPSKPSLSSSFTSKDTCTVSMKLAYQSDKSVADPVKSGKSETYRQSPSVSVSKSIISAANSSPVPITSLKQSVNAPKSPGASSIPTAKPVSSNAAEIPVTESFVPSKTGSVTSSAKIRPEKLTNVPTAECVSNLNKSYSESISEITSSLSCMSLTTSPNHNSDRSKGECDSVAKKLPLENKLSEEKALKPCEAIPAVTCTETSMRENESPLPAKTEKVHNPSQLMKGGDEIKIRDALWDIQEMVKDSPPLSNSVSVASSCSSRLSSMDSKLSSVSTSSSDASAFTNNNNYKPRRQPQMIIEDEEDYCLRDDQKVESGNLSKLRETHLARRRDQLRTRMPQLSELAEKDNAPLQNGQGDGEDVVEVIRPPSPNDDPVMPSVPDEFLSKLGLTQDDPGSDELSDQEIESKFTSLSLAFKTDSQTLEKRLEIQDRSRDIAEQNVDKELKGLRSGLATLNQICTDPQVREVLTKIQNHIDILEKSTARVSSRAEVLGAIQQEKRMSKAVDIMVHHVENLRRVHEREHAELEEARKLLQDSRSLGPSTIDIAGNERMLSRRSASVCPNNMLPGQATLKALRSAVNVGTAEILAQSSRRRVSEIALPKVLGGAGAPNLHLSSSMDFSGSPEPKPQSSPSPITMENSVDDDEASNTHIDHDTHINLKPDKNDAKSRFQAVVASTAFKSTVANTLRRASLERQNPVQQTPTSTPDMSRDNSQDKVAEVQDKEKQKNLEEEAFKKGYEQGMRASLGQDLSSLREQQNQINTSLGDMMDSIDNQMEEPKSLKEILMARADSLVPKVKISGWRIRMTFGCFFIVMAIISVIVSLFPVGSASLVGFRHYGRPPL